MGCLKHKSAKLNALEDLRSSKLINENRRILDEKAFDVKHAENLASVNRAYGLNLTALFNKTQATVAKFGIRPIPHTRTDVSETIQRAEPIENSFNQIDDKRKELGIYDSQISIGEYRQNQKLTSETTKIKPIIQAQTKSEEAKPPIEELNLILKEFVASYGGRVQSVETLLDRFGKDYAAAFDVLNRLIQVAKGKEKIDTLPEEVAHFIIEGLGENNILVQNIMNLVNQVDYRGELAKIDPEYTELYKNDDNALKKELAGKYLGQAIVRKFETKNSSILEQLVRTFKLLIDKMLSMFKGSDARKLEDIKKKIELATETVAGKVLRREKLGINFAEAPTHPIFYQTGASKKAEDKDQAHKKQEVYFVQRIKELEKLIAKSKDPNTLTKTRETVTRMKKLLKDFRETTNRDFLEEIANITLEGIEQYFDILDTKGVEAIQLADRNINYAREALEVLTGFPGVSDRVNKLKERFSVINKIIIEKIVNQHKTEKTAIPLETITAQSPDINRGKQWFGALQDLKNYLARTIGSVIKAAQNRISTKNKYLTDRIQEEVNLLKEAQKRKGVSKKDTYKIFLQNYKNTTILTREYTTEFYQKQAEAFKNIDTWGKSWLEDNTTEITPGVWAPVDDNYYNPNYRTIQKDSDLRRFYNFHIKITKEAREKLPTKAERVISDNFIANIKKSMIDQIFNSSSSFMKGMWEGVKNIIEVNEANIGDFTSDEELFGDFVQGNRFTKSLKPEEKSDDLGDSLLKFAAFANSYEEMSEVLPQVRLLQEAIKEQKFTRSSNPNNRILGEESNVYKMVKDYIEMQVLGKMKKEEGKITINQTFDEEGNVTSEKYVLASDVGDLALRWNSLLRIGLNPFNALGNLFFGEISNFIEAGGGRFFGIKDMNTATNIFFKQNFNDASVVNRLLEEINPLQELEDYDNPDKVRLKKLDGAKLMEIMYSPQRMGEKFIQTRTMLAVMLKEGMLTNEGQLTKEGKDMLKDEKAKDNFRNKVQRLNEMLHGRYSSRDAAAASQWVLVRAVFQFRKWIPAAIEARIGEKYFDVRLGVEVEGRYNSYRRGFNLMMGKLQGDINKIKRNQFTELDMYHMKKNMIELALLAASLLLYYGLKGGEDDDKWRKKPMVKFTLQMLSRVIGDLNFYYSPNQWLNLTKNALPVSKLGEDILGSFKNIQYLFAEEGDKKAIYRSGPRKGENKFISRVSGLVPGIKPLKDVLRLLKKDVAYTEPQ